MINIFRKIPVYIKVYNDKIEATDLVTENTISLLATSKFSTIRIVIADFNNAETLLRQAFYELGLSRKYFSPRLKVLMQIMEKLEGGLSDLERRGLRDLAEQAGAIEVYILEHHRKLSTQEALVSFVMR
jgi:MreB/Mbl protein